MREPWTEKMPAILAAADTATGLSNVLNPDGVLRLTLNRPEVHNAFDDALVAVLSLDTGAIEVLARLRDADPRRAAQPGQSAAWLLVRAALRSRRGRLLVGVAGAHQRHGDALRPLSARHRESRGG